MYLNAYVPQLTTERGIAAFCRGYLGHRFASTKQAVGMTQAFVKSIHDFLQREGLELVRFQKGVIFVGVAQEKVRVPRTTRKHLPAGGTIPWIMYSTAMVNCYYCYCRDKDFGPFFIKFCSYFPYPAKLCLNGHEYLKCQLAQRGIAFEAMARGCGPKPRSTTPTTLGWAAASKTWPRSATSAWPSTAACWKSSK